MPKKLSLLMISILICFTLTSCYDAREIDDEVYAIALGIDKGSTNAFRISIQYPNYKGQGGGGSKEEKGSGQQESSNVSTIEAPTILEGINMFGMAIPRRVSLMHIKVLVISEDLAREGVSKIVAPLERYNETRNTMNVIVSRGSAESILKENTIYIGSSLSKAIELIIQQSYYSNYFHRAEFLDLYRDIRSLYSQPIAIYAGVNDFNKITQNSQPSALIVGKGYLPGELARRGVKKLDLAGVAVFKKDKMVGSLDSNEFAYYQMIIGEFTGRIMSIQDKNSPGDAIVLNLKNSRPPSIKATMNNDKPTIDILIKLEGNIEAIQSGFNYEQIGTIEDLNREIENHVLEGMQKTIKKTQEELQSDIFGFGRQIAGHFTTIQEWENYNWPDRYPEAAVNVKVDVNIRRTGTMIRTTNPDSNTK